jgi:hypothetical protein
MCYALSVICFVRDSVYVTTASISAVYMTLLVVILRETREGVYPPMYIFLVNDNLWYISLLIPLFTPWLRVVKWEALLLRHLAETFIPLHPAKALPSGC